MNIHEELFVNSFIVREKRGRYLEFLGKEKMRQKITWNIERCDDLEEKYRTRVPVDKQNPEDIFNILKEKSAPNICHIISTDDEIDGQEMNLKDVLENHFFDDGTFISCIPGKLVYYASEEENGCFILEK